MMEREKKGIPKLQTNEENSPQIHLTGDHFDMEDNCYRYHTCDRRKCDGGWQKFCIFESLIYHEAVIKP